MVAGAGAECGGGASSATPTLSIYSSSHIHVAGRCAKSGGSYRVTRGLCAWLPESVAA